MPNNEFQEWVDRYETKTKMRVEFGDGFHLFFLPDKGFVRFKCDMESKTLMVKEVCGDGKFWYKFLCDFAKEMKLDKLATFLCREVEKMARLYKATLIKKENDIYEYETPKGEKIEVYPYNNNIYFAIQCLQQ